MRFGDIIRFPKRDQLLLSIFASCKIHAKCKASYFSGYGSDLRTFLQPLKIG